METPILKKIGYILQKRNGKVDVNICREPLHNDLYDELVSKSKLITEFRSIFTSFKCLELNHIEISKISQPTQSIDLKSMHSEGLDTIALANQKISNFLSSASQYLTITEIKLNGFFGDKSKESKVWNEIRKNIYHKNFGYRLVYELRNFSQHHGLPLSSCKISQKHLLSKEPLKSIEILINKNHLLSTGYKWKESLIPDIKSINEPIFVKTLCDEYMFNLRTLKSEFFKIIEFKLNELETFICQLFRLYKIPTEAHPVIFIYLKDDNLNGIPKHQEEFVITEIEHIKEIRCNNEYLLKRP